MPGWGSWTLWGLASYNQGSEPRAKQDTLFLGVGTTMTDLASDLGQYAVNQTIQRAWTYEAAPATRFNLTDRWCFEFDFDCDNADTGRLFQYDCATATSDLSLALTAGGVLSIIINNAVAGTTLTLPGISGSDQRFVVAWSAEPNVDTTGASDALTHYLCAWNLNTGAFNRVRQNTVVRPAQTGAMVIWAASTGGSSAFSGTPHAVRIGRRLHSPDETAADFVDTYVAPTSVLDTTFEHEGLPVTTSTGIHSRDNLHGPAAAWAVDKTRRMQKRTMSALWNERMRARPTWSDALLTSSDPMIRPAPGDSRYVMHVGWLRSYPVPDTASHIWVRVHLRSFVTLGSAVPLGVRVYSMAGVNSLGDPGGDYHPAEEVVTRDDSGLGEWCIDAVIPISRSARGYTYLALALAIDPEAASSNDAAERITVRAVHVVPCVKAVQGGLPFGEQS